MINQTPEIISQSKIEETDYNALKITLLGIIGVAASIFAVYEFNQFLLTFQYAFLWFSIVGMLVFLVINILLVFFVKHFLITWGIVIVETFSPLVFFFSQFNKQGVEVLLGGFFLFFFFTILGIGGGVRRFRNSVKMKFFEITKITTPKLVTGILILASILFYGQYFVWGTSNEKMIRSLFDETIQSVESISHLWYSGISVNQTVGELFNTITLDQLKKNPEVLINGIPVNVRDGLRELSPDMQKKVTDTLSDNLRKKAEEQFGPLDPNANVGDAIFEYIKKWVLDLAPHVRTMLSIALTILLFLSVKSIMFLLYWIINGIAFLIFKLLIVANFAVPGLEVRTREFVILP